MHAVTFNYGQRHEREIEAARITARLAQVKSHEVIDLGAGVLKGTSPLISDTELEQYRGYNDLPGGLEKTFVPMRNQLFLTIAFNRAMCIEAKRIFTGVAQEDYGGYPDCRAIFIHWLQTTSNCGLFAEYVQRILIVTPLMHLNKQQTVELALQIPGCYGALAYSHTAYDGAYPPTGHDHATLLRAKGFEQAGVPDPLLLRAHLEKLIDIPFAHGYLDSSALRHYADMVRATMAEVEGWPWKGTGEMIRDELNRG